MGSIEKTAKKVLIAMSGGVDSAVAAVLLRQQGYDLTGVFMCLGGSALDTDASGSCCTPADAADARRVASQMGFDLHVLNLSDEFMPIIKDFANQYALGRTPNPCIHCNSRIKFGRLIDLANSLGIAYVATGHYARLSHDADSLAIYRAESIAKDQSYALFSIARENLSRMLLPIGEITDKSTVREMAAQMDLSVSGKPDSQEICFAPDSDYLPILRKYAPAALASGEIVNSKGVIIGQHEGYGRFTIGQRRGIGISASEPLYVTAIDSSTARVTVGLRDEAMGRELRAKGVNWHCDVVGRRFEAMVQIRYNHRGSLGMVEILDDDTFSVRFYEDIWAITPGQAVVIYDTENSKLLGGGWIE